MDCIHAYWLALLQGLTEFLPISSSAHLILMPKLFGWPDQGLAFDVAVHVGTLLAVVIYFRDDLAAIVRDWCRSLVQRRLNHNAVIGWGVVIGTIPVGLAGLFLEHWVETELRSPLVIAGATIGFGLLLAVAEYSHKGHRSLAQLTWADALVIGLFQVLALIPGTSRSGITITGGLFLAFDRISAARFSFLLSIPVILLAGGMKTLELLQSSGEVDWNLLLLGVMVSALAAYGCIGWFLRLLQRIGMMPFVVYRLLLGGVLFYFFWPSTT